MCYITQVATGVALNATNTPYIKYGVSICIVYFLAGQPGPNLLGIFQSKVLYSIINAFYGLVVYRMYSEDSRKMLPMYKKK